MINLKKKNLKYLRKNPHKYIFMFQILLRAQYLEEENAKLREELQVQTTEKEDMKTAILQLNQRLLQNPPVISEVKTVQLLCITLLLNFSKVLNEFIQA